GTDTANPLATILSAAMLLRHSLKLENEAAAVERAVADVLEQGFRTPDIAGSGAAEVVTGTRDMGARVVDSLMRSQR
ncbi:MAG: 3-isopropylmalate dehydrogenase, partial [Spirochaetales bacterium]|nr:3-isopropylmalate dehydrogenase [Spirochaetales bacterium]